MKKLALALVFGVVSMGAVSAQTATKTKIKTEKKADKKAQVKGNNEGREHKDRTPEERAQMQANRMAKTLNLTADQTAKVREISLAKAQKMDAFKANNATDRKAKGAEMKDMKANWEAQLKDILTPDQYAKYEKERNEKMAERKAKHGDHQRGEYKMKDKE